MTARLKRMVFALLGKEPEAVVVSFWSGEDELAARMIAEIRELVPNRRHYVVTTGAAPQIPGMEGIEVEAGGDLYLQLRRALRGKRIGLAPVLFTRAPHPLRAAAFCLAPAKILAFNRNLERHHLRPSIASWLFLRGVPLDRIFLRPWKNDSRIPDDAHVVEGRPLDPSRRRILVVSPYFPYPLAHGGAVRIFNLLKEAAAEFDIFLLAFAKHPGEQEYEPVMEFCARAIVLTPPDYRRPRWWTLDPPEVCEYRSEPMRRLIAQCRTEFGIELTQIEYTQMASYGGDILVEHDVTQDLYRQVYERSRSGPAWWDYWRWKRYENRAVSRFKRVVAMSEKDALLLGDRATVIENGVDLERFVPTPEREGAGLLFVGSFNHFPNIEAFRFFHAEVWPKLRGQFPEMTWTVAAGRDHALYWRRFTGEEAPPCDPRIRLLDFVRDVRPLYAECNIVVVPTTVSAGTNLKVLEAMAMERAIVSTACGCAGLGLAHAESAWIADEAEKFAGGIAHLLTHQQDRARLARNARVIAEKNFDWKRLGQKQRDLWHSAC